MEIGPSKARSRTISPRQLKLDVPEDAPRYWMGGDPYSTHLMNVLSLIFPPGERLFIDAVRHFRVHITDPHLLAQVQGFLGQESRHSREHKTFNRWLEKFGVDADAIEEALNKAIRRRQAARTPIDDLAVTCAFEHFTAILSEAWLTQDEWRTAAAEPLRALWTWHSLEELDHKAVAFDVYREMGGTYATRARWMVNITIAFLLGVSAIHLSLLAADGQLKRPAYLARSCWRYWGPRGRFSRLLPAYLRYFRPGFHPWNQDHSALIARFEQELTGRYELVADGREELPPHVSR